jgi:hypothetical protein
MDLLSWIFFGPAKLIAFWQYAGVAVAAALIGAQAWLIWQAQRPFNIGFFREAPVFAGLLWLIFGAFEWQMPPIGASTQGVFLRLDLIVLVPILYVLTAAALLSLGQQVKKPVKPAPPNSPP